MCLVIPFLAHDRQNLVTDHVTLVEHVFTVKCESKRCIWWMLCLAISLLGRTQKVIFRSITVNWGCFQVVALFTSAVCLQFPFFQGNLFCYPDQATMNIQIWMLWGAWLRLWHYILFPFMYTLVMYPKKDVFEICSGGKLTQSLTYKCLTD